MAQSAPGQLWYLRGWLLLAFAAVLVSLTVLTVLTDHQWHGELLVWSVVVCAVGAVVTTVGVVAVTSLRGIDADARRGHRRDAVVRAVLWIAAGVTGGWLAALSGWGWVVVLLAVYVALNAFGYVGLYWVRRKRAV